jgi:hypothetical protein
MSCDFGLGRSERKVAVAFKMYRHFESASLRKEKKMLKKSLIAIAVLAIALPAVAGDVKIHKDWPTKTIYSWQDITTIDVILDVGYYIHIVNQDDIEVSQVSIDGSDPFFTYYGCSESEVVSNFHATITGDVVATSSAGGSWSATFENLTHGGGAVDEAEIIPGTQQVNICVTGKEVKIQDLFNVDPNDPNNVTGLGGEDDVKVAELTVKVVPYGVQAE